VALRDFTFGSFRPGGSAEADTQLQGSAFKLPAVKHEITLYPFSFAHNRKSL